MKTGKLALLAVSAAALGAAAYFTGSGRTRAPALAGKRIVAPFDVADAASVEIGGKVRLAAGEGGWTVATMQGYPADVSKISESLMKLQELKVGQVARGRDLGERTDVTVRDASGRVLASVALGDRHEKWGHGRYALFEGSTVLVADALDEFGGDQKRWCSTKVIDSPYVSFKDLADPALDDAALGFSTGAVATVTVGDATNRVATVGATVAGGTDRYMKLDGEKWVYVISKYAADSLLPRPEPAAEPDAEPAVEPDAEPAAEPETETAAETPASASADGETPPAVPGPAVVETEPVRIPEPEQ